VDANADGFIYGTEGAAFIRRANLLNDANREVRKLICLSYIGLIMISVQ
jgi:hypothetical protein